MVTGKEFANQANSSKYTNLRYSQYDCQAFVELVLRDCGVRNSSGGVYNWKGSNDMWRHALSWRGTLAECMKTFGKYPDGAWVFMVKHDGGEVARGYHDNDGNASHVGIYCRPNEKNSVRDSTKGTNRDGVGYRPLTDFTHIGIPSALYFGNDPAPVPEPEPKNPVSKAEAKKALETLTRYVEG